MQPVVRPVEMEEPAVVTFPMLTAPVAVVTQDPTARTEVHVQEKYIHADYTHIDVT